jgi:hypothetical protein
MPPESFGTWVGYIGALQAGYMVLQYTKIPLLRYGLRLTRIDSGCLVVGERGSIAFPATWYLGYLGEVAEIQFWFVYIS